MAPIAVLICDASKSHGSGHVMRQITLGSALRDLGFHVALSCYEIHSQLSARGTSFGLEVLAREYEQSDPNARYHFGSMRPDILVFDGYQFPADVIRRSHRDGQRIVVIDDNGEHANVACDVIVNQNLHATRDMYTQNLSSPFLLLGTRYTLVRPEVARYQRVSDFSARDGVLISLGGFSPSEMLQDLARLASSRIPDTIQIAHGFDTPHSLSPEEMVIAMGQSRAGIVALGTTTWEALCLGLPIIGIVMADNQSLVGKSVEASGLGACFDFRRKFDAEEVVEELRLLLLNNMELERRSNLGYSQVDGLGASRVAQFIKRIIT